MAKQNKQSSSSESSELKYRCLMTIRHDGKVYEPGSSIDLTEEQASVLVENKAIALEAAAKPKEKAE